MKKYFLIVLAIESFSLHAADQQMTDEEMALQLAGQDMQTDADFKAAQAMQTEEDAKVARAMGNDGGRKIMAEENHLKENENLPIHEIEFSNDPEKNYGLIKEAIKEGFHPKTIRIKSNCHAPFSSGNAASLSGCIRSHWQKLILKDELRDWNTERLYYLTKNGMRFHGQEDLFNDPNLINRYLLIKHSNFVPADDPINYYLYIANPQLILLDFKGALDCLIEKNRTALCQLTASYICLRNSFETESLKNFGDLASLMIRIGFPWDILYKVDGTKLHDFAKGKTFDQSLELAQKRLNLRNLKSGRNAKIINKKRQHAFDRALKEINKAKEEVAQKKAKTKALILDQIKIPALSSIVQSYLNDDVLCDSVVQEMDALKVELDTGLAELETRYQQEVEQDRKADQELDKKREFERQKRVASIAQEKAKKNVSGESDMSLDLDFNWDNYFDNQAPANKSVHSSSQNGLSNSNGMSQSSSSHNGLSNSSRNGSQSSSSNADWLRAHSALHSSSSHNGLSNAAHNGMQVESDLPQSQSSSSSDTPHGKGEKRKLDEDDNLDGAKRSRTENGSSNNSNQDSK